MPICPVCNAEYTEGQDTCRLCQWPLTSTDEKISNYGKTLSSNLFIIQDINPSQEQFQPLA